MRLSCNAIFSEAAILLNARLVKNMRLRLIYLSGHNTLPLEDQNTFSALAVFVGAELLMTPELRDNPMVPAAGTFGHPIGDLGSLVLNYFGSLGCASQARTLCSHFTSLFTYVDH